MKKQEKSKINQKSVDNFYNYVIQNQRNIFGGNEFNRDVDKKGKVSSSVV